MAGSWSRSGQHRLDRLQRNERRGALSALLGASADSPLYDAQLKAIGAADASDAIFASADYCPITDLGHADMAYEWMWGTNKLKSGELADQTVSKELATAFVGYQAALGLKGEDGRPLTTDTLADHLNPTYLQPSATTYLADLRTRTVPPTSEKSVYRTAAWF